MAQMMACGEGLPVDNQQQVVSVTDRVLGGQVWYNVERSRKPQTFTQVRDWSYRRTGTGTGLTEACVGTAMPLANGMDCILNMSNVHIRQSPSRIPLMEAGPATSASGAP